MLSTPIGSIVEDGIDPSKFVTKIWLDEIRTTPIKVFVRNSVMQLLPALKIQEGVAMNKVTEAFDLMEGIFLEACKRRKDPEKEYLKIIRAYPHRVALSEEFVALAGTKYLPKAR